MTNKLHDMPIAVRRAGRFRIKLMMSRTNRQLPTTIEAGKPAAQRPNQGIRNLEIAMNRPRVTIDCPPDRFHAPGERIIQFHSDACEKGGLISIREQDDGTLLVSVYHCDVGVLLGDMQAAALKSQCPNGRRPCHLDAPGCNVSPGVFVVERDGRQITVCGECLLPSDVNEAQARGLTD